MSWHIMVSKRALICGVISPDGACKFLKSGISVPIVPLHNTSASCLFFGLFNSAEGKPFEERAQEFLRAANLGVIIVECDGAYSNDKAMWHYFNTLPPELPKILRLCGNHGLHLIEMLVFHSSDAYKFLTNIYDVAKFMRWRGVFLQLIAGVASVVSSSCPLVFPVHDRDPFNVEVVQFCLDNCRVSQKTLEQQLLEAQSREKRIASDRRRMAVLESQSRLWAELSILLPSSWSGPLKLADSADPARVIHLLRALVFSHIPGVPTSGKWAKAWEVLAFMTTGFLVHGIFLSCAETVFSNRNVQRVRSGPAAGFDDLDGIDWGDIHGKRLARVKGFLAVTYHLHLVVMYTLVMEPLVWLTKLFMRAASKMDGKGAPLFMNMASCKFSPIWRVLQYYGSLLSGEGRRVILLYKFAGCDSFEAFVNERPRSAMMFRRLTMAASAALYRRFHAPSQRSPWSLCGLGDERLSEVKREEIGRAFFGKMPCCVDPLFGKVLRLHHGFLSVADATSPFWRSFFGAFSRVATGTVADVEFAHNRNRRKVPVYVAQ
jgi:hypothetical protein